MFDDDLHFNSWPHTKTAFTKGVDYGFIPFSFSHGVSLTKKPTEIITLSGLL